MTEPQFPEPGPALPRGLARPPYERSVYLARRADGGVSLWLRQGNGFLALQSSAAMVRDWAAAEDRALARHVERFLTPSPPARFAGLALDRPLLMGVVNVTPDSFSDGGLAFDRRDAIARGRALAEQGADIIDVGGESTRPGAEPVPEAIELDRVVPVVEALVADGLVVSIDTRHAGVMRAAKAAGARIVNDVTALAGDADSLAAAQGSAVVLMHMRGQPRDMQQSPAYRFAPIDVYDVLAERLAACRAAGILDVCVDPGIGFGKTTLHNCQLLSHLSLLQGLGAPVLLGVSRKRFIAALSRQEAVDRRLPGSLAAALAGLQQGAQILRVHDVAETAQAVAVWRAIGAAAQDERVAHVA